MKLTKLSLVAALAVSSAFAGGDIAPVEPVVEAPAAEACNSNTTINGKAVAYSYTWDGNGDLDWYNGNSSSLGLAATLDVSHKITNNVTANISAVGFTNLTNEYDPARAGYFEGKETGAFLNVLNITAAYGDTTFVLGRQLLDSPMIKPFDWVLAPGSFEAYTVVNKSISNLTLIGSYITEYRPNNGGVDFIDLTDDGDNWALGAAYSDAFDASLWYYNVDAGLEAGNIEDYTQIYADAGYNFGVVNAAVQYVDTDYDIEDGSSAYGIKLAGSVAGFDLMAAYVNVDDNPIGYVDNDSIYTSMWNSLGSWYTGGQYKVEAATEFSGISASIAYAGFDADNMIDEASEFDIVLGYGITDCISLDAIYSNTDYGTGDGSDQAMEFIATYKF